MRLIACIEDGGGMLFNNRRLSSDKCVVESILLLIGNNKLHVNAYTSVLFPEDDRIVVDEECVRNTKADEYCFVENIDVSSYIPFTKQIILYRWNRKYPSDLRFPLALLETGWELASSEEFAGHSHERITMEVYNR